MSHKSLSKPKRILVIEDEESIRVPLVDTLEDEGFEVLAAADGELGRQLALTEDPDLILLDLMLPRVDGFTILRDVRRDRVTAPVVILSARGEEWDRVQGFEYGADDYVVKPFSMRELLLRVHAQLERMRGATPGVEGTATTARFGEAEVDFAGYTLTRGGERIGLSRLELDLLRFFLDHEGQVFGRDALLDRVWGPNAASGPRTVDTHVLKLRKKIEPDPERPRHLLTVRHVGYKFLP